MRLVKKKEIKKKDLIPLPS